MFRLLRIAILLVILATVAQSSWLARQRATTWRDTLHVAIYPLQGDAPMHDVAGLRAEDFAEISAFVAREAARYGVPLLRPVDIAVAPVQTELPPAAPAAGSVLAAMRWSLHFRWWTWRHDAITGPQPQVRLFVRYHDPARHVRLGHSVGLEKGMLGLVNAYGGAEFKARNNVVIAHELLHTLGASDKYALDSGAPLYPDGYADPGRDPLHPQAQAEIMGGRIPLSPVASEMPDSLDACVIGARTAQEVGLRRPQD